MSRLRQAFFCAHLHLSAAFENSEKLSFSNFYLSFLKSLFSNFNFNPGKPVIFEEKILIFGENTWVFEKIIWVFPNIWVFCGPEFFEKCTKKSLVTLLILFSENLKCNIGDIVTHGLTLNDYQSGTQVPYSLGFSPSPVLRRPLVITPQQKCLTWVFRRTPVLRRILIVATKNLLWYLHGRTVTYSKWYNWYIQHTVAILLRGISWWYYDHIEFSLALHHAGTFSNAEMLGLVAAAGKRLNNFLCFTCQSAEAQIHSTYYVVRNSYGAVTSDFLWCKIM